MLVADIRFRIVDGQRQHSPKQTCCPFAIQSGLAPFNSLDIKLRYIVTNIGVNGFNKSFDAQLSRTFACLLAVPMWVLWT